MLRFKKSLYILKEIAAFFCRIDAFFDHEEKVIQMIGACLSFYKASLLTGP